MIHVLHSDSSLQTVHVIRTIWKDLFRPTKQSNTTNSVLERVASWEFAEQALAVSSFSSSPLNTHLICFWGPPPQYFLCMHPP